MAAHDVELAEGQRRSPRGTEALELLNSLLALEGGGHVGGLGSADSQTELVVRDEGHPLLVEDVASGGDVGGHIATNRVTDVLGSVGVELSSRVTIGLVSALLTAVHRREDEQRRGQGGGRVGMWRSGGILFFSFHTHNVDLCTVPETVNLHVRVGFNELHVSGRA